MPLSEDEKALLDKLTAKQAEKEDDDFDIEIWNEKGAGARVPYRKGKGFLQQFGIDMPEATADDKADGPDSKDKPPPVQRYFGSKKSA